MGFNDKIGERMKDYYEDSSRYYLVRRMPVIIRVDGKAFHTFTRGFNRPFDHVFMGAMQDTMKYLCENIIGAVLGYTQSDEISVLLIDYKKLDTCAWFDNNLQKMASISASMATASFEKAFRRRAESYIALNQNDMSVEYRERLYKAIYDIKLFDSRAFNIPREDVVNYFLWRQNDATRNSINMVGRAYFSTNKLYKKSCNEVQEMLFQEYGVNWNDYSVMEKRGSACIKESYLVDYLGVEVKEKFSGDIPTECVLRSRWVIDAEIPKFINEGREYISRYLYPESLEYT